MGMLIEISSIYFVSPPSPNPNYEQHTQCTYNVKFRCNDCCRKQVINFIYSERVFVALDIQHAKHMRCSLLSSVDFRFYSIFPNYLIKITIFGKSAIQNKICVLIFSANLVGTFLFLRTIQWDIVINSRTALWKAPLFVSDITENWIFST